MTASGRGRLGVEGLSKKERGLMDMATVWMDLENIMLSEKSQSERDKYHMISLTCGI